ncbi:hypothetical protein R3P38DRAFT_3609057 [Favolaschia claudopus]|uniref:Uncharacterized protein n=1 Tax=Favolaschia claudopus TaxID=2862362 RepID=A0AAW0A7C5_9AGAR
MHSIHSLAPRAPPATRSGHPGHFCITVSPAHQTHPIMRSRASKCSNVYAANSQGPSNPTRESKSRYATGLVDQAVKSLCEIWRPQDIPNVFLTLSKANCGSEPPVPPPHLLAGATRSSLSSSLEYTRLEAAVADQDFADNWSNLVSIKGFVHEVLRRSRTSGSVLQTALCYLEAIRSKVPELIQKEQSGRGGVTEFDSECRVTLATPAEALHLYTAAVWHTAEDVMDTVRVCDNEEIVCPATSSSLPAVVDNPVLLSHPLPEHSRSDSTTESNLQPSPLLCPRRAFLASLVLASKFTQDRCYPNHVWAKLSSLPAREIGRCERALGNALHWRLWVGKTPSASPSNAATLTTPTPTPVAVRCRSEASKAAGSSPVSCGSRRSSTLPTNSFAEKDRSSDPPRYELSWMGEPHRLSFSNIALQDQDMTSRIRCHQFQHGAAMLPGQNRYGDSSRDRVPPRQGQGQCMAVARWERRAGAVPGKFPVFLGNPGVVGPEVLAAMYAAHGWEKSFPGPATATAISHPHLYHSHLS